MSRVVFMDEETRLALDLFKRQTAEGQAFLLGLAKILQQAQEANEITKSKERLVEILNSTVTAEAR